MSPVFGSIKRLVGRKNFSGNWFLIPVGAMILSLPAVAQAAGRFRDRDRDDRRESRWQDRNWRDREWGGPGWRGSDADRHHRRDKRIDVDIHIGGGHIGGGHSHCRPEYVTREVRVWVPPVYRTVVDRKWVEPVYRTETERVWVPDRFEEREIRYYHRGRPCVRIERVLVEPGHYKFCERRVLVCEGRWETCERQELVCAGHYETRYERIRVADRHHRHDRDRIHPLAAVNPMLGPGVQISR